MKTLGRDLHPDRLATTDESGNRVYIHPEEVEGPLRTKRTVFYWVLIFIYLVVPWIYVNGKQIILLDIMNRNLQIFGFEFHAHDAPLLFFLFAIFAFSFALLTSLWGRVWCGWACPQTVFIDVVFHQIEKLVEGKSRKRKKLDQSPMGPEKIFKKSLKWLLFLLASLHIVHSFLGYFVGTRKLFWITLSPPEENWTLFITMIVGTLIILFDFGWFREQFCIIACPYGKIQAVMTDSNSLSIGYDEARGEPRRARGISSEEEGDCIDCGHCVMVCPTGIDIRRGSQQLECINCTACIDVCDSIMDRVGRPKGLIRYDSENGFEKKEKKMMGIRSFIYIFILLSLLTTFFVVLKQKSDFSAVFVRGKRSPHQTMTNTQRIVNLFQLHISYDGKNPISLDYEIKGNENKDSIEIVSPQANKEIKPGKSRRVIFVKFDKSILKNGTSDIEINIKNRENKKVLQKQELKLVGPFSN